MTPTPGRVEPSAGVMVGAVAIGTLPLCLILAAPYLLPPVLVVALELSLLVVGVAVLRVARSSQEALNAMPVALLTFAAGATAGGAVRLLILAAGAAWNVDRMLPALLVLVAAAAMCRA